MMEAFIDKRYHAVVLEVLNNIRIYMQVTDLSNLSKLNGAQLSSWALWSEVNTNNKWKRPPPVVPPQYITRKYGETV